jgi:DNA repair protein SbcC/Rad50
MKNILSNIFKPAWQSSSVEKRLGAIASLQSDSSEHQQLLFQLASDDADDSVRIAAIQQLVDIGTLHELSLKNSDHAAGVEAEKRLIELMANNQFLDETQYRNLLNSYPQIHKHIATHAEFSSIRTLAIENLLSKQLLDVLGATTYTDCRQLISEKLLDIEDLESARRIMRGKDKNAERIIKSKIDAFRRHEKEQAENQALVEKLIVEANYLAIHDWLPEFQGRYRAHRQQWDNIAFEIADEDKQRYQLARKQADLHYQRQQEIEQAQLSQGELITEIEALVQIIAKRDINASVEAQPQVQSQLQRFRSNWQALSEIIEVDQPVVGHYNKMVDSIESASQFLISAYEHLGDAAREENNQSETISKLNLSLKNLKWSNKQSTLQIETEVQKQLLDWRNEQKAIVEAAREKLDKIHKNINSIFRFSQTGNLTRAKQVAQKVEKALAQFDGKDQTALQERFDEAIKTLGDMGDWKNFATEPKYVELCDAMDLLTTSNQNADKRSNEMKALQQQWKTLGHSDISEQYWPRFKLAADKVYQSCAVIFEERHEIRKANLEQRKQYLDEMQDLLEGTDWDDNPDYKAVQSSIHNINSGFTSVKNLERNAGEKQWKQYSTLKAAVMAKLDAVYDDNIASKQRLIKLAETLAESAAIVENLTSLKSLQTRWKQVGLTRRGEDQKAWKAFKKQGDIIYNKVQEMRQSLRDETDQQLDAYRNIIKSVLQLAKTANDLAEADHQFSELQTSYDALPELPQQLPEKLIEDIQRDYNKACDQFDNCRSRIIKNKGNQQLDILRQKANLCSRLESLAASASDQQVQEVSQHWDAIELHHSGLSQRIEARRASALSDIDREAIGAERRMLCIRLEILKDIESPAEDKALRMKYQLEQMNQSGLGQQVVDSKQLIENMELDWLCMPGATAELQITLDQRFQRLLGTGKK